jgi:uncharacterized short protein YbdD (DUF466 family)
MRAAILNVGRGIRWYVKQATGEAKWDVYLDRCRDENVAAMSRRDFERHRAKHKENSTQTRCC